MSLTGLHNKLAELGLVYGTSGNASFVERAHGYVYIKSSGTRCDAREIGPGFTYHNVVQVPFGPKQTEYFRRKDQQKPSTDLPLHLAIYESNPDINCVIHTHSVHAAAYSILGMELDTYVTGTAELFGWGVPCVAGGTDRDAIIPNLRLLAAPERGIKACLMERHGVLAWGKTSDEALHAAEAVEWSAQIALLANSVSNPMVASRMRPMAATDIENYQEWYDQNYGQK